MARVPPKSPSPPLPEYPAFNAASDAVEHNTNDRHQQTADGRDHQRKHWMTLPAAAGLGSRPWTRMNAPR